MGINKLISVKVPVLNAIQDMGIDITKDVPTFTRWAVWAEKHGIGSYYSLQRKRAVLKVNGCVAELPCEASFVQGVLLGDFGCDCGDLFSMCFNSFGIVGAATTDTFLIIDRPDTNQQVSILGIKWEVQNNKLIFKQNLNALNVNSTTTVPQITTPQKVTIQYLGIETDKDGFPMVVEGHQEAIAAYIGYMFCKRSRFSPVKMDHGDLQWHWREWMRLASEARASDAELSDTDRQEIAAMISDPYIGRGMEVGMHGRTTSSGGYR